MLKLKIILVLLRCLVTTLRQVPYLHDESVRQRSVIFNCLGERKGMKILSELQGYSRFSKDGLEKEYLLTIFNMLN